MIPQAKFDLVADALLATGVRVTFDSLNEAFKERDRAANGGHGKGHSKRDITPPFDDWKSRRRYHPHLAAHDLPEHAEKAVAAALDALREAVGLLPPAMPRMVPGDDDGEPRDDRGTPGAEEFRDRQIAVLTSECRELLAALATVTAKGRHAARAGERKRGVVASTGRHFWDKLMQHLADQVLARGPMSAADLCGCVDAPTKALAAIAFEPITVDVLAEKLAYRADRKNYFVKRAGLYHLKRSPRGVAEPVADASSRQGEG